MITRQFSLLQLMKLVLVCSLVLTTIKLWGMEGFVFCVLIVLPYMIYRISNPVDLAWSRALLTYGVISSLSLPFLARVWWGEVPLLALIQLPKTELAHWIRTHVVMHMLQEFGISSGSFSPDFLRARIGALAITYLIPLLPLSLMMIVQAWKSEKCGRGRWLGILLIVAVIDFFATLFLTDGPSLTLY